MKRLALIIAAAAAASTAFAWSDSGHGAIAKIAYRHLTPAAKKQFDEMLKIGVAERYHNGPMAAVWADESARTAKRPAPGTTSTSTFAPTASPSR